MCSGCSGDFEGHGEEQDLGDSCPPEIEAKPPGPVFCAGCPSPFRANKYSPHPSATGREGGGEAPNDPGGSATREGDEYEVLVSAERIIERRTIRANCTAVNCLQRAALRGSGSTSTTSTRQEGTMEAMEAWQESRREREHSLLWTAKCYQTRSQLLSECRARSGSGGRQLIVWGLAGVTVFALILWLAVG
jgi:hypothetical protein